MATARGKRCRPSPGIGDSGDGSSRALEPPRQLSPAGMGWERERGVPGRVRDGRGTERVHGTAGGCRHPSGRAAGTGRLWLPQLERHGQPGSEELGGAGKG